MSQSPFTFQPIPDACPIPRGIVAWIGGIIEEEHPSFALWRDKEQIIIEAKGEMSCAKGLDPNDPHFDWKLGCAVTKRYSDFLEVIQGLLQYIDFRKTNRGYLQKDRNGQYYIKQKDIPPRYKVLSPPWATYIPEREVEFTVWGTCSDRRGIWKGKKVDIMYEWNDIEIWALDQAMTGARALDGHGLDLTYEVYGHLVGDDGSVIGLVTEAATGRMIGLSDMALVYNAISKIQNRGFLYRGCGTNRFMIQDGKIRLIELNCITPYSLSNRAQLEKDAERWHWQELQELFEKFRTNGQYGEHAIPPSRFTSSWKKIELIYPIYSPELPLGGILLRRTFFRAYHDADTYWSSHLGDALMMEDDQSDSTLPHGSITDVNDAPVPPNYLIPTHTRRPQVSSAHRSERRSYVLTDRARGPASPSSHPRNRLRLASSSQPYSRRTVRPGKAFTQSSDTQSSSSYQAHAATSVALSFLTTPSNSSSGFPDNSFSYSLPTRYSPDYVDVFLSTAQAMFSGGKTAFIEEE
ncbi:hypothetical protein BJ912DRAFT_1046402 [Pholiota molesta]|nr:hypothetical protein BJ912DRAFT_1046402 [Pholiota molesta]